MTVAFVVGNGKTRLDFDLNKLRGKGTIFGCNALHRDFKPDYLIAIDDMMIAEVLGSSFPAHRLLVPPMDECFEPAEVNPDRPRSNAGMIAMAEAIKRGFNKLYCLGFDFLVASDDHWLANIYDGTSCYGMDTRANKEDTLNRMRFLSWFVVKHRNIQFIFVYPRRPFEFNDVLSANVTSMYYDDFERMVLCPTSTPNEEKNSLSDSPLTPIPSQLAS